MKLAISSHDGKFDTPFSDRFGRCRQFVFIETETGNWQAKLNPAAVTRGGAGAQVVQFLADNGVEATISGRYGPTALSALEAAGIQAYIATTGTPASLSEKFLADELVQINTSKDEEMYD
jgi:predicted Fe-Mo cluster-binding NifX family protein